MSIENQHYNAWVELLKPVKDRLKPQYELTIDEISPQGDSALIDIRYKRTGQLKIQQTFFIRMEY